MIRKANRKIAFCYDFDKTLSPGNMQEYKLIPSFAKNADEFWEETRRLARKDHMDNNLAWMYQLVEESSHNHKPLNRQYITELGKGINLYPGVTTWFQRINDYGNTKGIKVEHYIISSGLKELIEGSIIADKVKRIYASTYMYDANDVAIWPAQVINYTTKTQFIFRIAKGCFEEYDNSVNKTMPDEDLYMPYENIVYIGDSETDIPCMRLVKSRGGYSIGVFDPKKNDKTQVNALLKEGRITYYAKADYSPNKALENYAKLIIDEVAVRENIHAASYRINSKKKI